MKTLQLILALPILLLILLICLLGAAAALLGWHRLDAWCESVVSPGTTRDWIIDTFAIAFLFAAAILFIIAL